MFIDLMLLPKKPCGKYYVHTYVGYNMYIHIILYVCSVHTCILSVAVLTLYAVHHV